MVSNRVKRLYTVRVLLLGILIIFSSGYACSMFAEESASSVLLSLGDVANNALEPAIIVIDLLYVVYLTLGTGLLTASVVKFFERRVNPLGVTISQVIFLFFAGLFVLLVPYLFTQSQHGIKTTIFASMLK